MFGFLPTFPLSLCYGVLVKVAARHLDQSVYSWLPGKEHYNWADFATDLKGRLADGQAYTMPSPLKQVEAMGKVIVIYLVLTWYFDHVVAANRGVADPPYFFLTPKYLKSIFCRRKTHVDDEKGGKKKRKTKKSKLREEDLLAELGMAPVQTTDGGSIDKKISVRNEKRKVTSAEKRGEVSPGLRVIGLKKTYFKKPCGLKSKNDVHAVKGIWFEAADKELLSLLGHNGAGKSTTFSMLTGVLEPTAGTAKICGFDIKNEIDEIRKIMGVVPQFDILWGELTAYEHMTMFSMIKGVADAEMEDSIDTLLESVGLMKVKYARVANFSGGMKRRLSVAMASIGNPRIIFLDEPTTGMDPVSRRDVWNLVQKLKKDKVVILTTHAMEEADILSDRIAVVCDGKLQCIGTPLYLKNTFGDGYRITLVINPGNERKIIDLMDVIAPSNKLIDESGGSMVFSVPIHCINEIAPLFSLLQHDDDSDVRQRYQQEVEGTKEHSIAELRKVCKDVGISHTTLEEVFMKVTGKKVSKYVAKDIHKTEIAIDHSILETIDEK